MDFITRQRFLTVMIVILVLLNLFSLGALWIMRSGSESSARDQGDQRGRGDGNIVEFLRNELNLTEEQVTKFRMLRREFDQERRSLEFGMLEERHELIEEAFRPHPDSLKVEKLSVIIGQNQIQLERLMFDHFMNMKSLWTPEQSRTFDSLIHEILERSRPPEVAPPPKDGRRPHDRQQPPPPRDRRPPQKENNPFH